MMEATSHRALLHRLILAAFVAGCLLAGPGRVRASEARDSCWHVELWSEEKWIPPGGTFHARIQVTRLAVSNWPASLVYQRDTSNTSGFGAITPAPASGGGTGSTATWNIPALQPGESWQARLEVTAATAKDEPASIANSVSLSGSEIDMLFFYLPQTWLGANPTTAANPGAPLTSEPVNAASGEFVLEPDADLDLGGPLPLAFRRYYASGPHDSAAFDTPLGQNWSHNFDSRLVVAGERETLVAFDRFKLIEFGMPYGVIDWTLNFRQEPVRYQLFRRTWKTVTDAWLLDPGRNLVYRFDKTSGKLADIRDRNGNRLTVTRDASGRVAQVADGLGRSLTFTYTGSRLTRVSDGTRNVDFTYDANTYLASATDPLGGKTTYANAAGLALLSGWTRPRGNTPLTQTWNGAGQVTRQEDALAQVTTMEYDTPAAGQTRVTYPDGGVRVFTCVDRRLGTAIQDPAGRTSTFTFNDREQPAGLVDRLGDATSVVYNEASGKVARFTDAAGNSTVLTYTAQTQSFPHPTRRDESAVFTFYNLTRVDYADGTFEAFTHDERGNVLTRRDRAGQMWGFTYDPRGLVLTETNPTAGVVTWTYNPDGTPASRTDADTGLVTFHYDALRRLIEIRYPDGSSRRFAYALDDRLTSLTDPRGTVTTVQYDANGNIVRVERGAGTALAQVRLYQYDGLDRLHSATDPLGNVTRYAHTYWNGLGEVARPGGATFGLGYDPRQWLDRMVDEGGGAWRVGRDDEGVPTALTTPASRAIQVETNKLGYPTRLTDPAGASLQVERDPLQRVTRVVDRLGRALEFGRDGEGRVTSAALPVVGRVEYVRDGLGMITRLTDPRGRDWDYARTPMGRANRHTDPLGRVWQNAYDALGRLRQVTYPDGEVETRTYDPAGSLTRREFSSGMSLTWTYDALGRPVATGSVPVEVGYDACDRVTATRMAGADLTAAYDERGRIRSVGYAGRMTVTYTYDDRGWLTRVADDLAKAWVQLAYDGDGLLSRVERSNGAVTVYQRDAAGRVARIGHQGKGDLAFTRDAEGQVTAAALSLPLDAAESLAAEDVQHLFDAASQVESPGFAHDARGRRVADPERTYAWDGAGRLVRLTQGGAAVDLDYTAAGELAARTAGKERTDYCYLYALSNHPLLAEKRGDGFRRFYVCTPGGELLYLVDLPATPRFYHFDQVGSTLFLTDAGGAVTDAYGYTPYGRMVRHEGVSDQPFTFVGRRGVRQEGAAGIYQMGDRYYDSLTARFLSRDPAGLRVHDPKSANPYPYAGLNPVLFIDPAGRDYYIDGHGQVISPDEGGLPSLPDGTIVGRVDPSTGGITWGLAVGSGWLSNVPGGGVFRLKKEQVHRLKLPPNVRAYKEAFKQAGSGKATLVFEREAFFSGAPERVETELPPAALELSGYLANYTGIMALLDKPGPGDCTCPLWYAPYELSLVGPGRGRADLLNAGLAPPVLLALFWLLLRGGVALLRRWR